MELNQRIEGMTKDRIVRVAKDQWAYEKRGRDNLSWGKTDDETDINCLLKKR